MKPVSSSPRMLEAVRALEEDAIIQIHGDRSIITYSLMFTRQRKFVYDHGSYGYSLLTPLEFLTLRRCEKFYCGSERKMQYLSSIGIEQSKLCLRTVGVDFDIFRPLDKVECRRRLGIEEDAFVIFYPGRFDYQKGTDVVMKAYETLKGRFGNVVLVMVGGNKSDPLYGEALKCTRYVYERVPHDSMSCFYSASDVTCYYWRPPALWYGGGGSVSVFESLACDTPVVSNTLMNLRRLRGIEDVGAVPDSEDDVAPAIERVMRNEPRFRCREVAEKYFSWDVVVAATLKDYGLAQ